MTVGDWLSHPQNWVFLVIAVTMVVAAMRVVSTDNIVHAVLYLVAVMAGSAALFVVIGAEFVAWTVVLVYIGAVIVLFLSCGERRTLLVSCQISACVAHGDPAAARGRTGLDGFEHSLHLEPIGE